MIIGIDSSLQYVKQYLESTGKYELYTLGEYVGPIDAFVYEDNEEYERFEQYQTQVANSLLQNTSEVEPGILMICAKGKTPKEIETLLDTKRYKTL